MEDLARLVSESMARHGMECSLDYRRLHWSRWLRCETSLDLRLVPSLPGILAVAEELIAAGESAAAAGRRMLAVLQVSACDDLAISITRLLAPQQLHKYSEVEGRVFVRYTVVQDDAQRRTAHNAFQRWLTSSVESATSIAYSGDVTVFASPANETEAQPRWACVHPPAPLPSGF